MNLLKEAAKNKFVFFLTLLGVSIIVLALLPDLLGLGKSGVGPAQLLIATVGATLAVVGVGITLAQREETSSDVRPFWLDRLLSSPNILWVVIGFSAAYLFLQIFPMFFDPVHRITYFYRYLPDTYPIGADITATLASIRTWFEQGTAKVYYPPLLTILFAPLLLIPYPAYYYVMTLTTVIGYFILACLIPFLIVKKEARSIILFVFGISVFAYGIQFELERGQFHTLAMLFCILAIYIFHRHPRYRFFAYVLFCMAVQFKIYPALFIVMLVDDWRDWKAILKRFIALGVANFLLLFLLGYSYFSKFITHIITTSNTYETWRGNHSIGAFFKRLASESKDPWLQQNTNLLISLSLAYFVICFLIIWMNAYRRNAHDIDALLLLACVLGGLLIPSINNDYTLPLLTAPFALAMSTSFTQNSRGRVIVALLLILASFAYSATLVPFKYRPLWLQNSFQLLMILLTATTVLSFLRDQEETVPVAVA